MPAGLIPDLQKIFETHTSFTQDNLTLEDGVWTEINLDEGTIVLDLDYIRDFGLPLGQREVDRKLGETKILHSQLKNHQFLVNMSLPYTYNHRPSKLL